MKKTVLFFILSAFCFSSFAANTKQKTDESVVAYRNAIEAMDAQDYGKALKYSEDAILYRKQRIENQINKVKLKKRNINIVESHKNILFSQ